MIQGNVGHQWFSDSAQAAMRQAAGKIIERAKQSGTPVIIWQNGRVVRIPSDQLLLGVWENTLAIEHRAWLADFDPQYMANWEKLLKSNQESALMEAGIRRLLQRHGIVVEPNEHLSEQKPSPDFQCFSAGRKFYVEVACISANKAAEQTGIPESPTRRPIPYRDLNPGIFRAIQPKARQCGDLDAPALVAVGSLHAFATMCCFDRAHAQMLLTGETKIAREFDTQTARWNAEPYLKTELDAAAYLAPSETQGVEFARGSISGILLCGVTFEPPQAIGLLHPKAARPFDPALLIGIEFGQVEVDQEASELRVRWTNPKDSP